GVRQESTAEHSWRLALMAMLLKDEEELKDVDMDKVIEMCLIHDLGEAFTGDIPAFEKKDADTKTEVTLYEEWVESFPAAQKEHWMNLLKEMEALETKEAQVYKALDKLEALITHNESPISTWLPLEYDLQMTYGKDNMKCHPYFEKLRQAVDAWTIRKIETEKPE
ncbi:MAG: HD domain-containing protein, partial [Erysipelotrichaceae bacterium]|nr:HD domain-containing protein [Erysipelotrichaceae bacterium]